MPLIRWFILVGIILSTPLLLLAGRPARANLRQEFVDEQGMRAVSTPDYVVHTDLPENELDLVLRRLEAMSGEYRQRTASISKRQDDRRLPLYLYSDRAAYQRAGGDERSAGFFDGERLLVCIGKKADARAWQVIQHEAFHQYFAAKLGYEVPVWLAEGMAEYFGESLYTGDGFVSGVVPLWRLSRLQGTIERIHDDELGRIISLGHEDWNQSLKVENYDIAWSLIHFLAQGEERVHRDALDRYIKASAKGLDPLKGFERAIGNIGDIQRQWRRYWMEMKPEQAQLAYARAAVQTVTGFTARSAASRVNITGISQLAQLARDEKLAQPRNDALPVSILIDCLDWAMDLGDWTIDCSPKAKTNVRLKLSDGTLVAAKYILRNGSVVAVEFE